MRRKRLLSARVRRRYVLAIPQVVHVVDAIDEQHPRLSVVPCGAHQHLPQLVHVCVPIVQPVEYQR